MKVMVISVGGSPEPVIYSLNRQQPDYVIYFTSRGTRALVREQVEPQLQFDICDSERLVAPDEQNLLECVGYLLAEVPRCLDLWDISADDLVCDFTGGTKVMSAALVLALSSLATGFSYIGGSVRNKDGLGVVTGGNEQVLRVDNPWDVLAVQTMREMELMFNRCRFQVVAEIAAAAKKRSEKHAAFFTFWKNIADAFTAWDNIQYGRAHKIFGQAVGQTRALLALSKNSRFNEFARQLEECSRRLDIVYRQSEFLTGHVASVDDPLCGELLTDIVANAVRRAEVEHKYDDAVARLYSAIEKKAKITLKQKYAIDNSHVVVAKLEVPAARRWLEEQLEPGQDVLQLPLMRSYELLDKLDDPLGAQFVRHQREVEKVLGVRNNSILAHGYASVDGDTYTKMLRIALDFIGLEQKDLPQFPQVRWGYAGLA